ncbi:hypothetical protein BH09ACT9_BH09ACT9_30250 [soil metagenome]
MRKQKVIVDELFSMAPTGTYWYSKGYNPAAVTATVVGAVVAMVPGLGKDLTGMYTAAQYSWFIGCGLGFTVYYLLAARSSSAVRNASSPDTVTVD